MEGGAWFAAGGVLRGGLLVCVGGWSLAGPALGTVVEQEIERGNAEEVGEVARLLYLADWLHYLGHLAWGTVVRQYVN